MLAFLSLALLASAPTPLPNVPIDDLDIQRYLGTWYELARLPNAFERGCQAVTATYRPRAGGEINIENGCHKDAPDGPFSKATAKGWVPDPQKTGALKVMFFWPFQGDYWVLEVGKDYEYALVGSPDRTFAWMLSRTPSIPDETYQALLGRLAARGYDVSRIERVPQSTTRSE